MSPSIPFEDVAVVPPADYVQCNAPGAAAPTTAGFLLAIHWLIRPRLKCMEMFEITRTMSKCINRAQTGKVLRSQFDYRQHLQYGQKPGGFPVVWRTQSVSSVTVCKTVWPVHHASSVLSTFSGRISGAEIGCTLYSSVGMRSSSNASALVDSRDAQRTEQLWEEYFLDRSQRWENRAEKMNSSAADFNHKAAKEALWVDDWSTPPTATLKLATQGTLSAHAGNAIRDLEHTAPGNRPSPYNYGKKYTLHISAREFSSVRSGGSSMQMQRAHGTSESIATLRLRLEQGLAIDSFMYVDVLKLCLKFRDLLAARQVHECIVKSGMDQNPYVVNTLLNVFIGCGRLQDARRVFDELEKKNVVSWTIMIGGYVKSNLTEEALEVCNRMYQAGAPPDAITCLNILKACASPSALPWGKEVHKYARLAGLEADVRVGTALVDMYAKCGSITEAEQVFENLTNRNIFTCNVMLGAFAASGRIDDARELFDRMEKRDIISYTRMIAVYSKKYLVEDALEVFQLMRQGGAQPDQITCLNILKACASPSALRCGKEVHRYIRHVGLESDVRVGTALVDMYAKCGSINEAERAFENLTDRNVFVWNVMLGAYASSGSLDDAREVFDRMETRDVITWTRMIGAYAQNGRGDDAYQLFLEMKRAGFQPDAVTYVSILNACASAGALEWVKEIQDDVRKAGLESDLRVGNALVHMFAKSGSLHDARLVFNIMEKPDVITWNIMIGAYAENGRGMEAYRLFLEMIREGFKPNAITYLSILDASASAGALEWVKEVHGHVAKAGLDSDLRVWNALVHMYAKTGSIDDARLVFDRMEKRNVITWSAMIAGLAQHGCGHEALGIFSKMRADNVKPDGRTIVAVLSACCHAGLLEEGRRVFVGMKHDYGIEPTVMHYTCMVDLLGRAGHLEEARRVIGDMPVKPDGAVWGALLGACRIHAEVELGELAANELLKLEPRNASAYVLLSNIYAAASKWEKVSWLRNVMQERGVRKEPGRSWIEVDNKIHDFFAGDRSHPEANAIHAELKKLTEKLKSEGYIPDTQLVLQSIDEEDKELALCSHSEKLAIAYGLMRTPPGKPIRVYKNLRVCSDCHTATKFISKVTRREIIARDANRFHHFRDGVCSCGDYW